MSFLIRREELEFLPHRLEELGGDLYYGQMLTW